MLEAPPPAFRAALLCALIETRVQVQAKHSFLGKREQREGVERVANEDLASSALSFVGDANETKLADFGQKARVSAAERDNDVRFGHPVAVGRRELVLAHFVLHAQDDCLVAHTAQL